MRPALSDYQHLASGKVREIYRIDDDHLLFVASDRISAFDYILDNEIPDKGRILTAMSVFFFDYVRGAQPSRRPARRPAHPRRGAGPRAGGAQARDDPGGVRRPRLPDRLGAAGLPEDRRGQRHRAAARPDRGQQVRLPAVHAGHQGRTRPARREHLVRRRDRHGRRRARQPAARPHPADLHPGRRPRADEGNHHRRHQVRVRRRRARQPGAGRRGLHPGLVAVLGRRHLPGGCRPAQLRQAVRPQLAD